MKSKPPHVTLFRPVGPAEELNGHLVGLIEVIESYPME